MKYTYFPGCSLKAGCVAYDLSTLGVCRALELEMIELEDWNCCGATAYSSINEYVSYGFAARNLVLASQSGRDLVTPCTGCYAVLNKAQCYLKEYPKLKVKVDEFLSRLRLHPYEDGLKVRHLLEILVQDAVLEAIQHNVHRSLEGLKVAPYYGCQLVRPNFGFDHPEFPQSLDRLMEALGAEVVYFPLKARCCGGSQVVTREELALEMIHGLLRCAAENGADCIATICPLCQTNLDAFQPEVNRRFRTRYNMPIFYFTQLLGFALDLPPKVLALEKNIVSPRKVLAKVA